jgi:hypothetical protein
MTRENGLELLAAAARTVGPRAWVRLTVPRRLTEVRALEDTLATTPKDALTRPALEARLEAFKSDVLDGFLVPIVEAQWLVVNWKFRTASLEMNVQRERVASIFSPTVESNDRIQQALNLTLADVWNKAIAREVFVRGDGDAPKRAAGGGYVPMLTDADASRLDFLTAAEVSIQYEVAFEIKREVIGVDPSTPEEARLN